jgi:hypothetical protein
MDRGARPQILVFTYHKTGTVLFERIMTAVAAKFGLRLWKRYGLVARIDPQADIALLPHSLVAAGFAARPFRAVRIVRDPRDIWVSSWLYHQRCREGWCTNADFDPTPPIRYPRVDFSVQHRPEGWKRDYLAGLGGKSYQQNLIDRDLAAGLRFELQHYTGWTLEAMRGWRAGGPEIIDVPLEALAERFDATLLQVFRHLGFAETEAEAAVEMARPFDLARMSDEEIASQPSIHSRRLSKWRELLPPALIAEFEARHRDLIAALGYPPAT